MSDFNPDWRVHPSEILKEVLSERGIRSGELVYNLSEIPVAQLNGILWNGQPMTLDVAEKLEELLAIPAGFWMALQEQFERPL